MKLLKYFSVFAVALLFSCSSDDDTPIQINETEDLIFVQEIQNETHTITLFTEDGSLKQGYNNIYFQIKDGDDFINNADVSWMPVMHMTAMSHSGPHSEINKKANAETLYEGYIIFQMAQNNSEYWELSFNYNVEGAEYVTKDIIEVTPTDKNRVSVFTGNDDTRYIAAFIEPDSPKVAVNDITVAIHKMENMMSFPIVNDYQLKIDPRMPSMGNHSSPNNEDLLQSDSDNLYHGKLSLTMTGYWKINLQLIDESGEVLKGEEVTETNESSSIYFEIEF
ncbi:hypothetical protein [Salegentibacter mishustinae]|uniref:hypothetical protein n=1 Tax=Salegentibacter mishustinae TaxID=270918 RepID=UPI0024937931|nr:hypothetical protein [Salegentibacter mishustinae]